MTDSTVSTYEIDVEIAGIVKSDATVAPPYWTVKVLAPFFLSWTVDKEPAFSAGAKAKVILQVGTAKP